MDDSDLDQAHSVLFLSSRVLIWHLEELPQEIEEVEYSHFGQTRIVHQRRRYVAASARSKADAGRAGGVLRGSGALVAPTSVDT